MMTVTLHAGASRIVIERMAAAAGEPDAANAITSGLGGVASAGPPTALWELGRQVRHSSELQDHFAHGGDRLDERLRSDPVCAEFVEAFDAFLRTFGFTVPTSSSSRRRSGAPTPSLHSASSSDCERHPTTATPPRRPKR
jgi:hypothetical protein